MLEQGEVTPEGLPAEESPLWEDVRALAQEIGERNLRDTLRRRRLALARDYLESRLAGLGGRVFRHGYRAAGQRVENLVAELPGASRPEEIVVLGAHYDSARGSPGANDNATGVAALLFAGAALAKARPACTVRLAAFCTEAPPFTRTREMGSRRYAELCRAQGERVVAMLSLETLGSYHAGRRAPEGPTPLQLGTPWRNDFVAAVGNLRSAALAARVARAFGRSGPLRCLPLALPGYLPGVRSSDHWSFWQAGYPAVMLTDTGPLRDRHDHRPSDELARLDPEALAHAAVGIARAALELAG